MQDAKNALDELSQEREARRAAEDRERAAATYRARLDGAKAEGREQGLKEGSGNMLRLILAHRFGKLPSWALERLRVLDANALASCGERALSANSLEAALELPTEQ